METEGDHRKDKQKIQASSFEIEEVLVKQIGTYNLP